MSEEPAPDLNLVVRMLKQMMTEQRATRDDMTVMSAMMTRMDHTVSSGMEELRAIHAQHSRFGNRLRELETTVNEKLAP